MNNITISGNLTKDVEVRTSADGKSEWGTFTVAVQDGYGDNKKTYFFDCNWSGGLFPYRKSAMTKGTRVVVSGKMTVRDYEANDGGKRKAYTIRANDVEVLNSLASVVETISDDDIPF